LPFANLTQGSARSVLGVTGNSTADVASIQGTASQFLVVNSAGTALAFTALSGDATLSGGAITLAANVVTDAKFRQGVARSVVGVTGNATANTADIQGTTDQVLRVSGAGTALAFGAIDLSKSAAATGVLQATSFPALTGEVTTSAGSLTTAIDRTIAPTWSGVHTFSLQDVHTLGINLSTSGLIQSDVLNSGSNIATLIRNSVKFTGSRPFFEVDWYDGSAYVPTFTMFGVGASGLAKEMRLYYDASNYFRMNVGSTGNCAIGAVGSANSLTFTATGVTFTATTGGITLGAGGNNVKVGAATDLIGFYNKTPVVQPVDGATLTNNVTAGGTTDTIANYTDLTLYANDSAAIRNNIYQLARKVKILTDNARSLGLAT
jgi:hypothetical protein